MIYRLASLLANDLPADNLLVNGLPASSLLADSLLADGLLTNNLPVISLRWKISTGQQFTGQWSTG